MIVGIHKNPHKGITKLLARYEKVLTHNGIKYLWLDINDPNFWEKVNEVDLFIFNYTGTERQHQMAKTMLPIIEEDLKIPCFPNSKMNWLYDDKVREYYFLKLHGYPVIPTAIFWNKGEALKWLDETELPVVFKLSGGASSENVVLVKNRFYGRRLIRRMFGRGIVSGYIPGLASLKWENMFKSENIRILGGKVRRFIHKEQVNLYGQHHRNYILFQKFLPNNEIDTRINILGSRAFFTLRHVRTNDFRASGSGKMDMNPDNVDRRCIKMALDISKRFNFISLAIDFLYDANRQPLISEISYHRPDWGVWVCPGYWDEELKWHDGHYWPQYLILKDLLNIPDLQQPEMKPDKSETGHWNIGV